MESDTLNIIYLDYSMLNCPVCWKNFVKHVSSNWRHGLYSTDIRDLINRELIEYGGSYCDDIPDFGGPYVIFNNSNEVSRFILTWS